MKTKIIAGLGSSVHSTVHTNMKKCNVLKWGLVLMLIVSYCVLSIESASAAVATARISGTGKAGKFVRVTTTSTASQIKPLTDTQAQHTMGYTTTISVSSQRTKTATSSATISSTVGATYAGVSLSAATTAGVAESSSYTIGSSVSYTIDPSRSSGKYRIEIVFPSYKTNFFVYFQDGTLARTTLLDKTISTMPAKSDAYYRLNRYAN